MNRAFDGARERGRKAFAAGYPLSANPYAGERATWAKAFSIAWREGWRDAQSKAAAGEGQLNFREVIKT